MSRAPPSGISSDSSSSGGGLIHSIASAATHSRAPDSMIAFAPLLPSRFSKIQPKVTFWISIGMTIIMLTMPMYTPERSRGTMLATMM
jgi:hypothetical protein